jgi:hypothetical protein
MSSELLRQTCLETQFKLHSTKNLKKILLKFNYFFLFLNRFDMLISKIILKNIYYFNAFLNKKYFKKQLLPHFQTRTKKVTLLGKVLIVAAISRILLRLLLTKSCRIQRKEMKDRRRRRNRQRRKDYRKLFFQLFSCLISS